MGFYWGSEVHWWAWGLGVLLMLVFWALVIWAIVALVKWAHGGRRGPGGRGGPGGPGGPPGPWPPEDPRRAESAEEALARRYAAGQLSAEEYHQRRGLVPSRSFAGSGSRS
jgi:putative membrane protein